jgi:hypothetical protein
VVIDNPITINETQSWQYGYYVVKITNKSTGEVFSYKWANVKL